MVSCCVLVFAQNYFAAGSFSAGFVSCRFDLHREQLSPCAKMVISWIQDLAFDCLKHVSDA